MALVAMHPCEDAVSGSLLYERMEQFADKQVTKWFGLSWAEFIQQSPDLCLKQLEICSKLNAKTDSETEKTLNQLREASR